MNPSIAQGPYHIGRYIKPQDDYVRFHDTSNPDPCSSFPTCAIGERLCGRNYKFQPRCVTVGIEPNLALPLPLRVVEFLIIGIDQFGFPVREVITCRAQDEIARQVSRKCYAGYYVPTILSKTNWEPGDVMSWGMGRSVDPESLNNRPDGSYRVPIPVRCRREDQIKSVQLLRQGEIITPNGGMIIDLPSQSIEVTLNTPDQVEIIVVVEPGSAII